MFASAGAKHAISIRGRTTLDDRRHSPTPTAEHSPTSSTVATAATGPDRRTRGLLRGRRGLPAQPRRHRGERQPESCRPVPAPSPSALHAVVFVEVRKVA